MAKITGYRARRKRQARNVLRVKCVKNVTSKDRMSKQFAHSVAQAVETHHNKGLPVAKYDSAKGRAYLEYPNGEIKYVEVP